jgi:RNA polymerase sigma-54 factor
MAGGNRPICAVVTLRQTLSQSLGQEMLLLPRMLQSIEILQLPVLELDAWLRQAVEENEALELGERVEPLERAERVRARVHQAALDHDEWLQSQPAREAGLTERLAEQLVLLDLDELTLGWTRLLIQHVDERGFLSVGDEELLAAARAAGLPGGESELANALRIVQSLEPRGVGARNAVEALLLQLEPDEPHYAQLRVLLEQFLDEIARNKLPSVARAMGLSMGELEILLARLRELDPRPAAQLDETCAPIVRPDVIVERDGDGFSVRVDASGLPAVSIDREVESLARDRQQPRDVRRYLRGKLERARWIVDGLEQRGRTLQRVAAAVFQRQRAFLAHGPGHLAPLAMRDLADEVGLHVSTVSRAVAAKYATTPWGTFALRHFFQSAAGGADCARDEVREAVREIFAGEDARKPLSDDDVVEALKRRGLDLARRTVTKYRRELGLPSSYRRRRFDAT